MEPLDSQGQSRKRSQEHHVWAQQSSYVLSISPGTSGTLPSCCKLASSAPSSGRPKAFWRMLVLLFRQYSIPSRVVGLSVSNQNHQERELLAQLGSGYCSQISSIWSEDRVGVLNDCCYCSHSFIRSLNKYLSIYIQKHCASGGVTVTV